MMSWDKAILLVILTVLTVTVDTQRWPLSGSCNPCKCSIKYKGFEIVKGVNCFNLNLTEFPSHLPTDMDVLDFANNNLQSDNVKGVGRFPLLQFLSLVNNNITKLDDSPFSKSSLLTSLKFAGNDIIKLTKNAFRGLRNLKTLHGLKIESAEAQMFEYLPRLRELDLEIGSTEIPTGIFDGLTVHSLQLTLLKATKIPKDIFSFGRNTLKKIRIVGPQLTSMHDDLLQGLMFLMYIYLEVPKLETLPERIFNKFQLSNLQTIQLVSVQTLPSSIFRNLNNMHTLKISKAEELPKHLFNSLLSLQELDLSQSFISQIPDNWFARLGNLLTLNISQTSLRMLDPESLRGLTQLIVLDISGNSLRLIPQDAFTPFQNTLTYLDLSENILKNIETDALGRMQSLKTLDLSDNKMSSLQSDMFNDLIRLRVLNMHENMLSFLPAKIFHRQQRLSKLNLGSNLFRSFPHALLELSDVLVNLDLSNNQIRNIDRCLEDKFRFLEFLCLKSNPLNCDCNILKLKTSHRILRLQAVCVSPDEFKNQHVDNISTPDRCIGTKCVVQSGRLVFVDMISPTRVVLTGPESVLYASSMASQIVQQSEHGNHQHHGGEGLEALFNKIEFKAIVGGVGGFIFMCLIAVVVYVKKRHDNKTRYAVARLDKKNGIIMIWNVLRLLVLTCSVVRAESQKWPLSGSCEPCTCSVSNLESERIRHVDCSYLGLTTIPENLPKDVDVLDFSNNKLQSDQVNGVQKFPFLQSLSLANNDITTLDDSPFSKSPLLMSLKLTGNRIRKLTNKSFNGLQNLHTMQGLKIDTAEPQVFVHLLQLKELDLEITAYQIPGKIFDGIKVHSLNLTLPKASELPSNLFAVGIHTLKDLHIIAPKVRSLNEDVFRGLMFLRKIYLEMPRLIHFPESIFNYHNESEAKVNSSKSSNLQEIQLNKIQNLPTDVFSRQKQLLVLGIKRAEELNDDLFDGLVNLQVLELSQTFISRIPTNWFAQLGNLVSLSLRETSLRRLDAESFTGLTQLKTLDLSLNSLRVIPKDAFTPLQNTLEHLDLSGNILKSIETGALHGMFFLKTLHLSDNKMSSLQNGLFNDLIRLSSLNIQENKLSFLPDDIFSQQQKLNNVNLASNSFSNLPRALLQVSYMLISLDLSHNQIHDVGICMTEKFPFLEVLSLNFNPLHCDCNILLLREMQPNLNVEGECTSPDEFENLHVEKISVPDRCFSEICDLVEEAVPIEPTPTPTPTPTKRLPGTDAGGIQDTYPETIVTEPITMSNTPKIKYTTAVVYTESSSKDIQPSTPAVHQHNTEYVHNESTTDTNVRSTTQVSIHGQPEPAGATSSATGESGQTSIYKTVEFRAVIGTVSGCLFLLLFGVVIYLKKKYESKKRFTLKRRNHSDDE
ncbi:uncharacterized protein LOC121368657 [Gigantopelta aegis]|uniref:uncharacterized protein LOC121368657 n=1 Tax=Gigantopelta aegis TaxID=1735272 RepID=UPI001B88C5A2|nr:uncharacterized protein LOC121368657 [Gigantopelta aegis]